MDCAHHWLIGPASDDCALGVCKYCGSERTFSNAPRTRYGTTPPSHHDRQTTLAPRAVAGPAPSA